MITHSLTALYAASSLSNLNIIALGGIYAPATSSFTGISTLDALSRLSIQTIFISATGVQLKTALPTVLIWKPRSSAAWYSEAIGLS